MRFDKVLVMGANKIACDCAALLAGKCEKDVVSVVETAWSPVSMLAKLAGKYGLKYENITDPKDITDYLTDFVKNSSVLIVSANNRYIFRKALIDKPGVEIINFHYALLPAYRGMNIPTWVIYNGETETGITWHYVTKEIDHGNIICQRSILIDDATTAFDVIRKGMQLAREAFASFYEELLEQVIDGKKADYPRDGKVYKARDLPNGGYLDLDRPIHFISRMLRAYDYHGMELIPKLRLQIDGEDYFVENYSIQKAENSCARTLEYQSNNIILKENGMLIAVGLVPIEIDKR